MNALLPRITVITPSYNQDQFLERTIRSVLDQGYPNLQYGIIDGNSTDKSSNIIRKYKDQLSFTIIEPDNGQAEAINKGLLRADGDIICYLNSDDTLLPDSLFTVAKYFFENPNCNWFIGNCLEIDSNDNTLERLDTTPVNFLAHALIRHQRLEIPQPAIFWKRELTDKLGLFDESYHFAFDYELWCRFLANGYQLEKINIDLATYRLHDQSKTCSSNNGFLEDHQKIERKYAKYLLLKERYLFERMFAYRYRQYVLLNTPGIPWKHIFTHPWWIASEQIRRRLLNRNSYIRATTS